MPRLAERWEIAPGAYMENAVKMDFSAAGCPHPDSVSISYFSIPGNCLDSPFDCSYPAWPNSPSNSVTMKLLVHYCSSPPTYSKIQEAKIEKQSIISLRKKQTYFTYIQRDLNCDVLNRERERKRACACVPDYGYTAFVRFHFKHITFVSCGTQFLAAPIIKGNYFGRIRQSKRN